MVYLQVNSDGNQSFEYEDETDFYFHSDKVRAVWSLVFAFAAIILSFIFNNWIIIILGIVAFVISLMNFKYIRPSDNQQYPPSLYNISLAAFLSSIAAIIISILFSIGPMFYLMPITEDGYNNGADINVATALPGIETIQNGNYVIGTDSATVDDNEVLHQSFYVDDDVYEALSSGEADRLFQNTRLFPQETFVALGINPNYLYNINILNEYTPYSINEDNILIYGDLTEDLEKEKTILAEKNGIISVMDIIDIDYDQPSNQTTITYKPIAQFTFERVP